QLAMELQERIRDREADAPRTLRRAVADPQRAAVDEGDAAAEGREGAGGAAVKHARPVGRAVTRPKAGELRRGGGEEERRPVDEEAVRRRAVVDCAGGGDVLHQVRLPERDADGEKERENGQAFHGHARLVPDRRTSAFCLLPSAFPYASGYSRYPCRTRSGCMRSPSFSLRRDSKPFTPVWSVPVRMQTNSPPRLWQTMSSWRQSAASDLLSSASSSFALIQ